MHDEELEKQVFSDSLLQLWQTGGDAVRANATIEHHDVRCQKTAIWFSVVHVTNGTTYHVWMYLKQH